MTRLATLLAGAMLVAQAPAQMPAQQWEPYSAGLQARAAGGDAAAQFAMGEAFRTGNGIGQDREQAIVWYRRAAPRDPRAADALAVLLFTKGERKQAIPLLQASAARRNAYALYILGTARFNGDYVAKDIARGYADMRLAAATLPQAQHNLGLMEPYITPIDRQRADALAAQAGGPEAGAPAAPDQAMAMPPPVAPPKLLPRPLPTTAAPAPQAQPSSGPAPTPVAPAIRAVDLPPSRPTPEPAAAPAPRPAEAAAGGPKSGGWRIQLGAYGSQERAAGQWTALVARVPALARLTRTIQPAGTLVRLQASGLADRDAATALCADVAAAKGVCLVLAPASAP